MKLGEIIREYRLRNKISMGDFARASGLSKPYVSMLEANKNSNDGKPIALSVETLQKVTCAVGISPDELLRKLGDEKIDLCSSSFSEEEIKMLNGYRALSDEGKQLVRGMIGQLYRKYKRGDVVKVNFGFSIGHEEGGLHYAVVLSKFDNTKNSILTVMPLTSEKPNFNPEKIYFKNLYLGKEIMEKILLKLLASKEQFEKEVAAHISYMNNLQTTNVTKEQLFECKKRLEIMNKKRDEIVNQIEKILQMKKGSIALADQLQL